MAVLAKSVSRHRSVVAKDCMHELSKDRLHGRYRDRKWLNICLLVGLSTIIL